METYASFMHVGLHSIPGVQSITVRHITVVFVLRPLLLLTVYTGLDLHSA